MGKVLTARNATIHTARAEIKTLTIEGKQVTLAVFRQLQRHDLIDRNTGELLGVPWGIVNYFWGDCAANHLHVVWQDGDDLRRDCVYQFGRTRAEEVYRTEEKTLASWPLCRWGCGPGIFHSPFESLSRHPYDIEQWERSFDLLAGLPQLFIAV